MLDKQKHHDQHAATESDDGGNQHTDRPNLEKSQGANDTTHEEGKIEWDEEGQSLHIGIAVPVRYAKQDDDNVG